MILQRLVEFADRIPNLPPPMYSPLSFKWQIELDNDGRYRGITPLSDGSKKNKGLTIMAPNVKRSGTSPVPLLLADKAEYVLGIGADSPQKSKKFNEFLSQAEACAESTGESSVISVVNFLKLHREWPVEFGQEIAAGDNIIFRVDDVRPTDLHSVQAFWAATKSPDADVKMQCLICGRFGPVDRVSPIAIKGLAGIGGQSSGMALVSANKDAFLSFGAKQALIAPTCRACGEAYANSINYMINNDRYRLFIGPAVFLFWTKQAAGFNFTSFFTQPQEEEVKELIRAYKSGNAQTMLDTEPFYALSLSASASRVVIRDWLETTIPVVQANLARWFELQRLDDFGGSPGRPFGVNALAASLYLRTDEERIALSCWHNGKPLPFKIQKKLNDQMVANIPRSLVRCALHGGPLPDSILAQAVARNRAERSITRNRAALIKTVLLSQMDNFKEGYMERLDETHSSPGYLCGRLLAELDYAQRMAVNAKATLVDRYYGSASSAPATVFGYLMRNHQAHMSKLRKEKYGLYFTIDKSVQEILSQLGAFPKVLTLKDQALFALGFYHQKNAARTKNSDTDVAEEE